MSVNSDTLSFKIVFFLTSDVQGCHLVKNHLKISSENDENLACSYISHSCIKKNTTIEFKIYIVSDAEKYGEIRQLYFKNVNIAVVVFDVGKENITACEKIIQDIKSHNSNCIVIFLGHKINDVDDSIHSDLFDIVSSVQGHYFEFSDAEDLGRVFDSLEDFALLINNQILH